MKEIDLTEIGNTIIKYSLLAFIVDVLSKIYNFNAIAILIIIMLWLKAIVNIIKIIFKNKGGNK